MADQLIQRAVLYGCAVTAEVTPSMNVAVAAGAILFDNTAVPVAAVATLAIGAADPTNPRWDLVLVDSAGAVTVLAGTPTAPDNAGAVPMPLTDGTKLVLAAVYVDAAVTTIVAGAVTDQRQFALAAISPYKVSGLWYGPPANGSKAQFIALNNVLFLVPFFTAKSLAVQTIGINVQSAAGAGSKARLGIYRDDGSGGLSLLSDAGQVAIDATGERSVAISQTLVPGWWWFACAFQSFAGSPQIYVPSLSGWSPVGGSTLSQASTSFYGAIKYTGISGALPATPSSPDYSATSFPAVYVQAT